MTSDAPVIDLTHMSRTQPAALPLSADVAEVIAAEHGVCIRPLAMRRINTATGRIEIVPIPCGSTREDQCRPCADKARRLRMVQCRQGWHLDEEPVIEREEPSDEQKELMTARADLFWPTCDAGSRVTNSRVSRSPSPSPNSMTSSAS